MVNAGYVKLGVERQHAGEHGLGAINHWVALQVTVT